MKRRTWLRRLALLPAFGIRGVASVPAAVRWLRARPPLSPVGRRRRLDLATVRRPAPWAG